MTYRRVRIVVSLFFALVAMTFAVLWVRSYHYIDIVSSNIKNTPQRLEAMSGCGLVCLEAWHPDRPIWGKWSVYRERIQVKATFADQFRETTKFRGEASSDRHRIILPYWFLVTTAAGIAVTPFVLPRFSLRTMLIGTTLIAGVLGAAVWTSQ